MTFAQLIFWLTALVFLVVGVYVSKYAKDPLSFYIMNRQASTILVSGTTVAGVLSAVTFCGLAGQAYKLGATLVGYTWYGVWLGLPIGMLYFARRFRAMNVVTMQELFVKRYDSKAIGAVATAALAIGMMGYCVGQFMGSGMLLAKITGLPYEALVALFGISLVVFLVLGGEYGVTVTSTLMTISIILAIGIAGPVLAAKAGGLNALTTVLPSKEPYYWAIVGPKKPPLLSYWGGILGVWLPYAAIAPFYAARCFSAKNDTTVLQSASLSTLLYFILPFFAMMVMVPAAKLLEPTVSPAETCLAVAMLNHTPPVIGGIGCAGIFAALLSTAAANLLYVGFGISRDIYKTLLRPNATPRQELTMARVGQAIAIAVAVLLAFSDPSSLFWLVTYANGAFVCAWLFAAVGAFEWRRATRQGALASMVLGPVSFVMLSLIKTLPFPAIFGALVISALSFVVGSLLSSPTTNQIAFFEEIRRQKPGDPDIQQRLAQPDGLKTLMRDVRVTKLYLVGAVAVACIYFGYFLFSLALRVPPPPG